MSIQITKQGIMDTLQDKGRYGFQHIGIPPCGYLDYLSAQLTNVIVGNPKEAPIFELHFPASSFIFNEAHTICISGANFVPVLNDKSIALNTPIQVCKNDTLHFMQPLLGKTSYLSINGNIVSEPFYVSFEYDLLMRETKRIEPGLNKNHSNFFTTQYIGMDTLKQDTLGYLNIEKKNILNQIISVQDSLGSAAYYAYDPLNNLAKIVDPQGTVTSIVYNLNNKMIYKKDPLTGAVQYQYNAFNELISSKNANGQTVSYQRDALGRATKRSEPEGDTVWVYDTASSGIGKLQKIISPSSSKEYVYDKLGRQVELISKIKDETYSIRTRYDDLGRVSAQVYPSNFTVYNCYSQNGHLSAVGVKDSLCSSYLWKATDYDASSNVLKEEDQNGIETAYAYNSYNQITGIKSERLGVVSRKLEYEYDLKKNLVKRADYDFRGKVLVY